MSNNLGLTQVGATQTQKTVSINDQAGEIDAAITEVATYEITSTNARTLTNAEFRDVHYMTIDENGGDPAAGAITLTVPAIKRGEFFVINDTAFDVTVTIAAQSETAPVISAGDRTLLTCDGTDVRVATVDTSGGGGGGATESLFKSPGIPFRGAMALKTGTQAIGAASDTTVAFDTESGGYDSEGFHDNSTNNERMTVPPGVRRVRVTVGIKTSTPSSGDCKFWIEKNASGAFPGVASQNIDAFSGSDGVVITTGTVDVVAGDFFSAHVNFNLAGSITNVPATFIAMEVIEYNTVSPDLAFAGVYATRITSAQTIGTGDGVAVAWNGEDYDTDVFHDNSTNNSRLTVPAGVTRVRMHASLSMTTPSSGEMQTYIAKNDSTAANMTVASVVTSAVLGLATAEEEGFQLMTGVLDVVEGDFFEVFIDPAVGGSLTNNVASHFTMEVVERSALVIEAALNVPFRGARVQKSGGVQAIGASADTEITFDVEDYDTDNIFDSGANTRLTVPDGVTKIRLTAGLRNTTPTTNRMQIWIEPDAGGPTTAIAFIGHDALAGSDGTCLETPVISVTPGQFFELQVNFASTGSIVNTQATFFAMEIIESIAPNGPVLPVSFFFDGAPASSQNLHRMIVTDPFVLPDELDGSQAHVGAIPSSVTVLDVLRNGSSIGGISVAATTGIATFSTSGSSNEEFRVGDRLEIDAPATINAIGDISVTLRAILMQ